MNNSVVKAGEAASGSLVINKAIFCLILFRVIMT